MESKNIYSQLASIPRELADKITNAKTGGGRSLNAIHDSLVLSSSEKHLLLFLGSQLNYTKDFINQYRFISMSLIAEKMSITRRSVSQLLNGYKTKTKTVNGLIEKGYINKIIATIEEQKKGWSNHYCLTSKIFDEYMSGMIEEYHLTPLIHDQTPSETVSPPLCNHFTPPSETVSPKVPVFKDPSLNPSINAVEQKPAAIKKEKKKPWKPTSKMKTWLEKTDDEKRDTILNQAVDAHYVAIKKGQARHFPFRDAPDLVGPILDEFGIDMCRGFFESLKNENRGCDVRKLSTAIKQFACPAISAEPMIPMSEIQFPDEIIKQVETNNMYIAINSIKLDDVKIETFPIRLKKFYDSLKSKRERMSLKKEIALMGLENFLKMRATAIIRCTYEELFTESVRKQHAFFT